MNRACIALVTALALSLSGAASAQQTFADLSGTWWFHISGKARGVLFIAFSESTGGSFVVEEPELTEKPSFGFSRALGAFFDVADGQTLSLDPDGNVRGTIELTDPTTNTVIGTLRFRNGKPNWKFTKWSIRATLVGDDGIPVETNLIGRRTPEAFPVLTGQSRSIRLVREGVTSSAFDLVVTSDTELGLPAYSFTGSGPVRIDGVEVPDAGMAGRFMLSPRYGIYGLLEESSDFGTGGVSGKLRIPKIPVDTEIPRINLLTAGDPRVRAKGTLEQPVEAVLKVTPTSFDYGALALTGTTTTKDQAFSVSNIGAADTSITGGASFLSGSSAEFSFVGATTYSALLPTSAARTITVRFAPTSTGTKTAQVRFSVDGGPGAKVVTLTGVGGIAAISVNPTSLSFVNTTVGGSVFQTVTVTNTGDGTLAGSAKVTAGPADFALTESGSRDPLPEISYSLGAGASKSFSVRFNPTSPTGAKSGTVTLTGGAGATVVLSGVGI